MNEYFIQIKTLEGELKISHKKGDFGLTLSTKELVYQKPHANYHIKLEDIISITPFEPPIGARPIMFNNGSETVNFHANMQHYRLYVKQAVLHNRSGIFKLNMAQLILSVISDLLHGISKYAGLDAIS